jgi:hypothetical protein
MSKGIAEPHSSAAPQLSELFPIGDKVVACP